jgi:hypothetical protein
LHDRHCLGKPQQLYECGGKLIASEVNFDVLTSEDTFTRFGMLPRRGFCTGRISCGKQTGDELP